MEWVASTLTPPPNLVYPALLKLMRTPQLPGVGGRLWLSEHQRQVKEQVAWLSDSTGTARVVAG